MYFRGDFNLVQDQELDIYIGVNLVLGNNQGLVFSCLAIRRAYIFTHVSPSIFSSGDNPELHGSFNYSVWTVSPGHNWILSDWFIKTQRDGVSRTRMTTFALNIHALSSFAITLEPYVIDWGYFAGGLIISRRCIANNYVNHAVFVNVLSALG